MATLLIIVHIIVCLALIMIVLLQTGKGASMGAAFGGSSQTIFGSSGATPFLTKLTTIVAVVFMFTSLVLAFIHGPGTSTSVVGNSSAPTPQQAVPKQTAPLQPAPTGTPAAPAQPSPAKPVTK
jgi:preprotein translocase subunit SecG